MRFATPRLGSRVTRIVATLGLVAGALAFSAPPAGATAVDSVSTGAVHGCVLTSGGGVKCWGYNNTGMVGDGTKHDRLKPVGVTGLSSGVADVQAVWDHSCALTNGGAVKCWGHNGDGELGDGTLIQRLQPVGVTGLNNGVQAISLGFDSGCALTTGGGVKCWGYNGNGQLGDGTRTTRKNPVDVFGLTSGVVGDRGRLGPHLRPAEHRRRQVLGPERARRGRRRHPHGRAQAGRGVGVVQRCGSGVRRVRPHLRAVGYRQHEVLGQQRHRRAR